MVPALKVIQNHDSPVADTGEGNDVGDGAGQIYGGRAAELDDAGAGGNCLDVAAQDEHRVPR
ncbi:hypothetical protein [Streptomyces sp. NPDC059349]|uniref:hypothetical protein n=1 Tax=Streptomyces sp. NPDC059349 TaxID=3346808 RepID=UPI0036C171AB